MSSDEGRGRTTASTRVLPAQMTGSSAPGSLRPLAVLSVWAVPYALLGSSRHLVGLASTHILGQVPPAGPEKQEGELFGSVWRLLGQTEVRLHVARGLGHLRRDADRPEPGPCLRRRRSDRGARREPVLSLPIAWAGLTDR